MAQRFAKLWLYTDWIHGLAWAKDPAHYREVTCAKSGIAMRVAHGATPIPAGYRATGRGLACDHIEPVPTMRDMVKAIR